MKSFTYTFDDDAECLEVAIAHGYQEFIGEDEIPNEQSPEDFLKWKCDAFMKAGLKIKRMSEVKTKTESDIQQEVDALKVR